MFELFLYKDTEFNKPFLKLVNVYNDIEFLFIDYYRLRDIIISYNYITVTDLYYTLNIYLS